MLTGTELGKAIGGVWRKIRPCLLTMNQASPNNPSIDPNKERQLSYSTDPALDASRHYDALYARQDLEDRARADMAPPQSVIHQIIQEDDLLAADRARNVNKAERATQANADRALDLQIKFQNLTGAWA